MRGERTPGFSIGKSRRFLLSGLLVLLFTTATVAQDIPAGVRYKVASDPVNAAAKKDLENAIASDSLPNELLNELFVCGPVLWNALKPSADKILLDAKPIFIVIPWGDKAIQTEGRSILKLEERQSFWRALRTAYPSLKTAKVRKAHADEISHYWAEIPFDIEEPFFVVETASERFVVHLPNRNGKTPLFWIDLVGDFRTLNASPKPN